MPLIASLFLLAGAHLPGEGNFNVTAMVFRRKGK